MSGCYTGYCFQYWGALLESIFGHSLTLYTGFFLALALGLALTFEFVNGFHDTANAVATVIYTHSLRPTVAVVWSGIWNLIGVLTSTGAVAFGVIALLPSELVLNIGTSAGFAMVFALLFSAILWNLGTWYFGLPASSSHTLIGSILGVGLANNWMQYGQIFGEGVNWSKTKEIGLSLLISPMIGFCGAALVLLLCKALIKNPDLYTAPKNGKAPPFLIRSLLVLTCTGVSYAHGSNDGQKGMGLIMLILIGVIPSIYAVDMAAQPETIQELVALSRSTGTVLEKQVSFSGVLPEHAEEQIGTYLKTNGKSTSALLAAIASKNREIGVSLDGKSAMKEIDEQERLKLRTNLYLVSESLGKLNKANQFTDPADKAALNAYKLKIEKVTRFIPAWVKVLVALALGLGTMIGWKRIVVTVGEKIGKEHLTYAQGASAELVAMTTIGAADMLGLPVSTTHVLSSGIAGTMAANRSGVQLATMRNLLVAWVLTLPVCVSLGAIFFGFGLNVVLKGLGLH